MPNIVEVGGGGGFPSGWKDLQQGEAIEAIQKNAPMVMQRYGSWDTQLNSLPSPEIIPGGSTRSVSFSTDGIYLGVKYSGSSSGVYIYKRSGDTFTKLNVTISYGSSGLAFSHDGNYLGSGRYVYKRSGDTFKQISDLGTDLGSFSFSQDSNYIAIIL